MNLRREQIIDGISSFKYTIPSAKEIKFIHKIHSECQFFRFGIKECRRSVADDFSSDPEKILKEGFSKCHGVLQKEYKCSTMDLLEDKIEDSEEGRLYFKSFSNCFFKNLKPFGECRKYLDDHPRRLFREKMSSLESYKVKLTEKNS